MSPQSDSASTSEDPWAHVDELKRVAQRYLDEHHHEYPKVRNLPVAQYGVVRRRTYMADPGQPRCGSRARIETNLYGNAVGDGGEDVISCARPKGHSGQHITAPMFWALLRRGWKVATWEA